MATPKVPAFVTKGIKLVKRNRTATARAALTQQYANAGAVTSRRSIARQARVQTGGQGG